MLDWSGSLSLIFGAAKDPEASRAFDALRGLS